MAPVYAYKTILWQQVFKPLQYFTNQQRWAVGKKHPAVVAAAFNADNVRGVQIKLAAALLNGNYLHGFIFFMGCRIQTQRPPQAWGDVVSKQLI